MKKIVSEGYYDKSQRERMAGAFGRIITDNYSFSESELGTILIELTEDFVSGKR